MRRRGRPRDALALALALAFGSTGCGNGPATAAPASPTPGDEGPAIPPPVDLPEEGPPRVTVVVRAGLAPGRPVPYRLTFENRTRDVLVPFSVEASDGTGGSTWGRTVAGEVVYDESADRFVETPVYSVVEKAEKGNRVLLRSALFPGEALVVPRSGAGLQQCNVFVPSAWGFWGTA